MFSRRAKLVGATVAFAGILLLGGTYCWLRYEGFAVDEFLEAMFGRDLRTSDFPELETKRKEMRDALKKRQEYEKEKDRSLATKAKATIGAIDPDALSQYMAQRLYPRTAEADRRFQVSLDDGILVKLPESVVVIVKRKNDRALVRYTDGKEWWITTDVIGNIPAPPIRLRE